MHAAQLFTLAIEVVEELLVNRMLLLEFLCFRVFLMLSYCVFLLCSLRFDVVLAALFSEDVPDGFCTLKLHAKQVRGFADRDVLVLQHEIYED